LKIHSDLFYIMKNPMNFRSRLECVFSMFPVFDNLKLYIRFIFKKKFNNKENYSILIVNSNVSSSSFAFEVSLSNTGSGIHV
jgi:hypothetical protein